MRLLDDERGQSVQVGAAILLGFVVIAITIYQVQVVSSQNAEVEFNHNQEVREDMTELRNAIKDAGTGESSRSASMQLGTQYPARTIFVNPTPPRGILRTESIGDISIENATVSPGTDYSGDADPRTILNKSHETSRIYYTPNYAEFGGASTTRIEHSLGYNTFDNGASSPITPQSVVNGDSITLTVVRGNVSEQGTGAVSVDPRTVTATDEIEIEPAGGPITIDLPTDTPDVWNETLGETFDTGEEDARVTSWNPAAGTVRVALDRSQYSFQIGMVGVGNGVPQSDRYDVDRVDGSGSGGSGGQDSYSLNWADPEDSDGGDPALSDCNSESCTWDVGASDDDTLDLSASLDPAFDATQLEFTVDNDTVASIDPASATTGQDGSAGTELTAEEAGTVSVRATTDGAGDVIEIGVENVTSTGQSDLPRLETRVDDLTGQSQGSVRYVASYDVTNTNSSFERVDVTFVRSDGNQERFGRNSQRAGIYFGPTYGSGNSFDIVYDVIYSDSNGAEYVAASSTISDTADASNPTENDDLAASQSAQFTSWSITDSSQGGNPRYRYTYDVSQSGNFSEVIAHALNVPGSGESGIQRFTQRSRNNRNIQLGYGGNEDYRVGYVVRDGDGVVVDVVSQIDNADGSGEYSGS